MFLERTDVRFPLWRKKVDGTFVRLGYTPVPIWVARMWDLPETFAVVKDGNHPDAGIRCSFANQNFKARIVPHRGGDQYRLFLEDKLRDALARTFLMSYMRELDAKLGLAAGRNGPGAHDDQEERAFWEFADLEFDAPRRHLRIVAHYVQQADFPHLFARLAGSAPMRRIDDEISGKGGSRIHKQPWRPRAVYETEIGAKNVVYMLADCPNGLLYIGEAGDMVARFHRGHQSIPGWTHYRYDLLPTDLAPHRVAIERMLICDADAILGRRAEELPASPNAFRLVNAKIDR